MTSIHPAPTARPVPMAPVFSRREWERALLGSSDLFTSDRTVALVLAHLAEGSSRLPVGGPQTIGRLAALTRLPEKAIRAALARLQDRGWIDRPDIHTWTSRKIWPITLTMPPAPAASPTAADGAVRTEPAHPGRAAS